MVGGDVAVTNTVDGWWGRCCHEGCRWVVGSLLSPRLQVGGGVTAIVKVAGLGGVMAIAKDAGRWGAMVVALVACGWCVCVFACVYMCCACLCVYVHVFG